MNKVIKRYELQIGVYIDAESIEEMWEKFKLAGLHDTLNEIDAEDRYEVEIVAELPL